MQSNDRTMTNLLQRLYRRRTTRGVENGLMRRCERRLAPLRPHLPLWHERNAEKEHPQPKWRTSMKASANTIIAAILLGITGSSVYAAKPARQTREVEPPVPGAAIVFQQISYDGRLSDSEARFLVDLSLESTGPTRAPLFDGELAIAPPRLPNGLRMERQGNHYELIAAKAGRFILPLEIVVKVKRAEPWSEITFKGPAAAIASVNAKADGGDVELQLLTGTLQSSVQTNGVTRVKGFLGADQTVGIRWMRTGGRGEVERKPVLAAETAAAAQVT